MLVDMVALQRAVALGMAGYVRAGFRTRTFGLEHLRPEPATILAPNHRSDNDVPVLVSALAGRWAAAVGEGVPWPTFAADDHAFFRGFLAGYPEGIPMALRRLLWPVRVGGVLERYLQCVPVRQPGRMRLVELLRHDPDRPLDGQLPPDVRDALFRRAGELGRPVPDRGGDVLDGRFADLLWTLLERDLTTGCEDIWRAHLRSAVGDFRRLVAALRGGGLVVIFPEGRLIADGRLGPLQPGLASLVRRGRARLVQPVAISYDRLTPGRTVAYVSIAEALDPSSVSVSSQFLERLRRAIPLTAGQIAATVVRRPDSAGSLMRVGAEWVERAEADGRPIEPALRDSRHALTLRRALWKARRLGADHEVVRSTARELVTANETS
jgi:1-acyl-sn-glycerol-3-phosphate acyltransferase